MVQDKILHNDIMQLYKGITYYMLSDTDRITQLATFEDGQIKKEKGIQATVSIVKYLLSLTEITKIGTILGFTDFVSGLKDTLQSPDSNMGQLAGLYDKFVKKTKRQCEKAIKKQQKLIVNLEKQEAKARKKGLNGKYRQQIVEAKKTLNDLCREQKKLSGMKTTDELGEAIYKKHNISKKQYKKVENYICKNYVISAIISNDQEIAALKAEVAEMKKEQVELKKVLKAFWERLSMKTVQQKIQSQNTQTQNQISVQNDFNANRITREKISKQLGILKEQEAKLKNDLEQDVVREQKIKQYLILLMQQEKKQQSDADNSKKLYQEKYLLYTNNNAYKYVSPEKLSELNMLKRNVITQEYALKQIRMKKQVALTQGGSTRLRKRKLEEQLRQNNEKQALLLKTLEELKQQHSNLSQSKTDKNNQKNFYHNIKEAENNISYKTTRKIKSSLA